MSGLVPVSIHGIAAGGAGVGRLPDGRAVFVPGTAPGDEAQVRVVQAKKRWARAELVSLDVAGPHRRTPPCPHHGRCGGCALEHLTYPAQLAAKADIVAAALRRIGGLEAVRPEVVPSPREVHYRNRVSFTLVRGGGAVTAGFHAFQRPGTVVDVDGRCLLPEEAVARVWDALRDAWGPGAERLPTGRTLRLTLRGTEDGVCTLLVEGGHEPGDGAALVAAVPDLAAVWWRAEGREVPELVAGAERVVDRWRGEPVRLQGALFLQVNRTAAALLEDHVLGLARTTRAATVVDAYCGVGRYTRALAREGAAAVGIEWDEHAVAEARRDAPPGARFEPGRVEDILPGVLPADLVVTNPPRAGMAPEAVAALAASPPRRLLYVSCDPATLARDLGRLGDRYAVRSVRAFDLFPQTAHVETVAELESR